MKDAGILCKEAENHPCHEMVHVVPAFGSAPFRIVFQQLDIELIEPPGRLHIDWVVFDLLDRGNAGERQEEAEMLGKVRINRCDSVAADEVFGFQRHAIGREDELRFGRGGLGALSQCRQRDRTAPGSHTAIWMLLRWRTPPGTSDAFVSPFA